MLHVAGRNQVHCKLRQKKKQLSICGQLTLTGCPKNLETKITDASTNL